ncbi:hypothetical protein QBK93_26185, partial [Rhizobium leguminosarum]|uniref:hypothetical protein n=1 Tax=Rhizobium leguminosarum TaxID=384 RepID=UPI0024A8B7B1
MLDYVSSFTAFATGASSAQLMAVVALGGLSVAALGLYVTARLLPRRFCFEASDEQLVVNKAV